MKKRVFSFSRFLHYLHKQRRDPAVDIKGLASWNTGFNFMSRILRKNFPTLGKDCFEKITDPEILVYLPPKKSLPEQQFLICPGGGYR